MTRAIKELEERLDYHFENVDLLLEALVHRSFAAESKRRRMHNQRLEFLGDAVLQLVVSDLLFNAHPDWQEGNLSQMRAVLCREHSLVELAEAVDLGNHIHLGKGEARSGGRERPSNLADAFEAVVAAIYLDGGLPPVERLLRQHFAVLIEQGNDVMRGHNAKGALQELTQQTYRRTPFYTTLEIDGPEHAPVFRVSVSLGEDQLAVGEGATRKTAEKDAALTALEAIRKRLQTDAQNQLPREDDASEVVSPNSLN